jgi:dipeptidyl-peptidase-3
LLPLTNIKYRSAFTGMRITLRQTSPESESIYDFIIELYKASNGDWKSLQEKAGISDEALQYFLEYAAMFLGNCGNYKSFGDSKFIPRGSEKAFDALAAVYPKANEYYKATKGAIFSNDNSGMMHLGYPDDGHLSTYYPDSKGITKGDISAVSGFLEKKGLLVVSCNVISF